MPPRHFEESLHCLGAEEEPVLGHRAGMMADLAPREAKTKKDKGSGWRVEAGKLRVSRRGSAYGVCVGRNPGGRKRRPRERSICRIGTSILPGLRANGCRGEGFWLGTHTLSGGLINEKM